MAHIRHIVLVFAVRGGLGLQRLRLIIILALALRCHVFKAVLVGGIRGSLVLLRFLQLIDQRSCTSVGFTAALRPHLQRVLDVDLVAPDELAVRVALLLLVLVSLAQRMLLVLGWHKRLGSGAGRAELDA